MGRLISTSRLTTDGYTLGMVGARKINSMLERVGAAHGVGLALLDAGAPPKAAQGDVVHHALVQAVNHCFGQAEHSQPQAAFLFKTASGNPILSNDPHLSLISPPVWWSRWSPIPST